MGNKGTFLIRVFERQNTSWQGSVTWVDRRETENFRSMLELIRLMDTAMDEEEDKLKMETGIDKTVENMPWKRNG